MSERLLESRISALRGQVRRLLVLHGLSWVVATVVPLVILAGTGGLVVPPRPVRSPRPPGHRGRRRALGAGKRVLRPLFVRFADLDIALKIEERWPGLHDRLASTIQFLRLNPGRRAVRLAGSSRGHDQAGDRGDAVDRFPPGHRVPAYHPDGCPRGLGRCPGLADWSGCPCLLAARPAPAVRPLERRPLAPGDPPGPSGTRHHPQDRPGRLVHPLGPGPPG